MSESRLVYSTDGGDRRRDAKRQPEPEPPGDGIVRVSREQGARGGKKVTVVRGLPPADAKPVASELKRLCGSGGSVRAGAVEIQGDHREQVASHLRAKGYEVKLAGG